MPFLPFTSTEIRSAHPVQLGGNQNDGWWKIGFSDGSWGLQKTLKDWLGNRTGRLYRAEVLAVQEFLAARVGEVLNAPIRDCAFSTVDAKTIVMPYVEGVSGEQAQSSHLSEDSDGLLLRVFDHITANADRKPKNWLITPEGNLVGIDHALCNFRPRSFVRGDTTEILARNGVTAADIHRMGYSLQGLAPIFALFGMSEQHQNMMGNLSVLSNELSTPVEKAEFHGNQYVTVPVDPTVAAAAAKIAPLLVERAKANEPHISREIEETCHDLQGERVKPDQVLKSESSIERKLAADASDYLDSKTGSVATAAAELHDALRYTIKFDNANFASRVSSALRDFEHEGFEAVKVKNFFHNDPKNTYRGINAVFKESVTNQFFEVQFHTPQSAAMVEQVHPLYEQIRVSDPNQASTSSAREQMSSMWQAVPIPPNVDTIGTVTVKKASMWEYYKLISNTGSDLAWYRYNGVHAEAYVNGQWQTSRGFLDHYDNRDPLLESLDSDPTMTA